MSSVAPLGSVSEQQVSREEESERIEPVKERSPQVMESDVTKLAEKTTLNDFQYTGKGAFIDKIF